MNTVDLLEFANDLNKELAEQGVSESWLVQRKMFKSLIQIAKLQLLLAKLELEHGEMKQQSDGASVATLGGSIPVTLDDRKAVKEAVAINRQIGKRLRELRSTKK